MRLPKAGERWEHWKGGSKVTIIETARIESTLEPVVVYQEYSGEIWVRPLDEFMGSVEYERDGHSIIPRFKPVNPK